MDVLELAAVIESVVVCRLHNGHYSKFAFLFLPFDPRIQG